MRRLPGRSRGARARRAGIVAAFVLACPAVLTGAAAASLGGVTAVPYVATSGAMTAGPRKITCDNFSGAGGLHTRPVQTSASCGTYRWSVRSGIWLTRNGGAVPSGADAVATLDAGATEASVEVTITNLAPLGGDSGIVIGHNGLSGDLQSYLGVTLASGPSITVRRMVAGSLTTVLTIPSSPFGITVDLRVSLRSSVLSIWLAGGFIGTYTLSAADRAAISGGTRVGMRDSGRSSTFTDIIVSDPWPA